MLLATAACAPAMAQAQTASSDDTPRAGIDDIVVTATRTGETRLQDTPLAVTAFDAAALERTGLKDIRDLTTMTPNLQVTQNGAFAQVYIRGVGSNNVFGGSDPSSTIHLDGIYLARPASYFGNFLDVERIEVLRGPQGTLYGRNSVGGTISIVSRKPTNEYEARAQLTYGNYEMLRGEGYVSGPIVRDVLAASVSIIGTRRDGYIQNIAAGQPDADNERTFGIRGQLRFTPSAPLEVIVRGDYLNSNDRLAGYVKLLQRTTDPVANSVLGDYRKIAANISPLSRRRQQGVAGEINYDLGGVALKSLTGYRENQLIGVTDTDATTLNTRRTDQFEAQRQFSEELTLSGELGPLGYIVGAYYFSEWIKVRSAVTTFAANRVAYQPLVETEALAGFGQLSYALGDKVTLTAGIRYTDERKDFDQFANQTNATTGAQVATYPRSYARRGNYQAWTPKFGIEFRPAGGVLVYASATKGFKSGGFNMASVNPAQGFAPETLWSYEAGAKLDLLDRTLRVNLAAFHYDYQNLQVQAFITPGVTDITNASDARVDGVEVETVFQPARWAQLGANLAYLDARYKNYPGALGAGNVTFDASGNRLNLSPRWSYTVYAQGDVPLAGGSVIARTEWSYRSRQYFTAANTGLDQQAPYGLLGATLGYTLPGGRYDVMVFGRNLTNRQYVTSTASFASGIVGRVGEPRVYGVRLVGKF
ncbi:TonB-dependent receptor [Sphingomonas hengshuiensis]|nr:TonB-dependent receptor [Sphingomonas hengshuiensis]